MLEQFYRITHIRILVCFFILTITSEALAQQVAYSRHQQQTLEAFLRTIEKEHHVSFVYDASQINRGEIIETPLTVSSLDSAIKYLQSIGLTCKVVGDKVILQGRKIISQEQTVEGDVTEVVNGKSEPMVGVSIVEKGTTNGTITDVNGHFQIKTKSDAILIFTIIGYTKQEVSIAGRTKISVVMEEDVSVLGEVVITGYQEVDKKLFTGSTVNLKGSDIKQDGVTDVSRMLAGRAAGVSVQNVSGTFGTAPKIRIRGATSITGDNKPLWVVDGVVLEDVVNISNEQLSTGDTKTLIGSSVAGLNPDDIESFQILKDASATAQYGARAMNGVIVITTKRGKVGKPVVSYTANFSTYLKPTYNQFDIMNSADQMSIYMELERKGFLNLGSSAQRGNGGVFVKMHDLNTEYYESGGEFGLPQTDEAKREFLRRYAGENTNWFDVLFRNSLMQEHSVSISSGTEKSQLYFSTSYLSDDGWTIADRVKRFTGNARANFNLSDKLTVGLISQGSIRDQLAPGTVGRRSNPVEGKYDRDFDINPFSYSLNTSRTLTPYDEEGNLEYFKRNFVPFNIVHELGSNKIELSMIDLKLQGDISYKILPTLKYSMLGALRYAKTGREHKVFENSNMANAYRADYNTFVKQNNRFLYRDPNDLDAEPVVVLPYGGFYNTNDDDMVSYNFRNTLDFNKTFDNTHILHLFASQELRYADRQTKYFYGYGYQFDKGGVPYVDPKMINKIIEGSFDYYGMGMTYDRFLAFMVNGTYSYRGKYNVSATSRYDGSNRLGKSRTARWLPTWNFSASWNIDTERFMEAQRAFDRLTLRATYGLTASMGNATNSSLVLNTIKATRPFLSEVESKIEINELENRNLTWEKQYETNIGIDAGLFGERLTLTLDWYNRNGFDLISPMRTSAIGGQFEKLANYAEMRSRGLELTANATVLQRDNKTWRTQLTLAKYHNEVTHLNSNPMIWNLVSSDGGAKQGYPFRGLYSIDFKGLDSEDGTPFFIDENGELSKYVNLQSEVTKYLKYEGPVDPTFSGGFFNSFTYRSFTLSALITFSGGNKIRLDPVFNNTYSDLNAVSNIYLDRWLMPGDEQKTDVPSIVDPRTLSSLEGYNPYAIYNYSNVRIADGDFVRLKQVSLTHNISARVASAIRASNLSVSAVFNNPLLLYTDRRLRGQDPEFFNSGGVALPVPKQITLSIKAGF